MITYSNPTDCKMIAKSIRLFINFLCKAKYKRVDSLLIVGIFFVFMQFTHSRIGKIDMRQMLKKTQPQYARPCYC